MQQATLRQFISFALIGVAGFAIDAVLLAGATRWLHFDLYSGRVISFVSGMAATWFLNRTFTFSASRSPSQLAECMRFFAVASLGGVVNVGVYSLLVYEIGLVRQYPVIGVACGSISGLFVNFPLAKLLVFRARPRPFRRQLDVMD